MTAPSSHRTAEIAAEILAPICALLIALCVGSVLIIAYGDSPLEVYGLLIAGTWNASGLGQVLFKATPLIFTGLSVSLALRAGLFNIGAEGQVILGAFACAWVGMVLPAGTPRAIAVPLCIAFAFAGGAAAGALPGWLKSRFGAHEVIATIMLNFVATALASYLVTHHFHVRESVHTPPIIAHAHLLRLGEWISAWQGSAVNLSLFLALASALWVYFYVFRTGQGFALRVAGLSPGAAVSNGISLPSITVVAMALSGGLAGLCGVNFVMGYKHYFEEGFAGGVGYLGIAVALLGRNHPGGVVMAALVFGTLSQGGLVINRVIPKELVDVLQAVIILAMAGAAPEVRRLLMRSSAASGQADPAQSPKPAQPAAEGQG